MKSEQSFWDEVERRTKAGEQLDVHSFRVQYFTDCASSEVTPEQRRNAKNDNFLSIYSVSRKFNELFGSVK